MYKVQERRRAHEWERKADSREDAIPKMSDFDKGYILGKVENMAEKNEQGEHTDTENDRKE